MKIISLVTSIALYKKKKTIEILNFILSALEMVGPQKRLIAGIGCQLFFTAGYIMTAGFAYYITDWRTLQLALTLPSIAFLVYWW